MAESLQVKDIAQILSNKEDLGFFHVNDIIADVKPGWWLVTLQGVNTVQTVTLIMDNDQIAGEPFTLDGNPLEVKVYARVLAPAVVKKSSSPSEIISMF